eukprot:TRINITY_DN2676_c0_g1_i3.p1 TRINITY_DN2676_c0_g1~~TRINITY_DN2676_c0_g1_i3.p1  ORF type:complete len:220 (+),score=31.32 TRINITY_DN2676_c0_g1_i3:707-1366(+)
MHVSLIRKLHTHLIHACIHVRRSSFTFERIRMAQSGVDVDWFIVPEDDRCGTVTCARSSSFKEALAAATTAAERILPNCKLVKSCPSAMKKENMGKALERIAKDHPNPIFVFQGTEARSDEATRQIGRYAATAAAAQELSAPAETKKSATVDGQEGKLDAMVQKHRDVMRKMIEDHTLALREHERKRSELEEAHASIVRERDEYRAKYEALVALQGQEQ